ncbi:MAG: hypothetical protein QOI01_1465 [Mycobacterium sp.]|jgi:DNA-directed RNA polymerase specialized sigma24 family protein|nr:hypothetical protein [Mycobacterium sp.]
MSQRDPAQPPRLALVSGDRYSDWKAVYEDNATWVYRSIFARVGNQPDAQDLTAEVFLAALRPLRLTATVAEVWTYLRATARTVLLRTGGQPWAAKSPRSRTWRRGRRQ